MRLVRPSVRRSMRPRRFFQLISLTITFAFLLPIAALAQGVRGTINGVVTDKSGGVVATATVKLVNVATNQVVRTVQSNATGNYELIEIEPATYNLVVSGTGFADTTLQMVVVEPNRHLTLDVALAASGASEQLTVTAGQELIDHDSATLGTTVENKRVEGLPLDGRNILDLALLQPGVNAVADSGGFGSGNGFRVNGSRAVENNFTLNGANNNELAVGADFGNEPRPDAVQEFRLLTSNFEAEFGRNTGSVINVVVKGGSSSFHGDARIFYRPTFLSAAQFFDNLNGLPKRIFERKEFGGNFGGPLPIPFIDRGQRKSFFFFDYEGRRELIGATQELSDLPSAAERNGDFSALLKPNNTFSANPIQLVNPITGQPFANNMIPSSMISPIAKFYLNFLPTPDASGRAGVQGNQTTNNDYVTARFDQIISDKQQASFIANYFNGNTLSPFAFGGANSPGFPSVDLRNTYSFIFEHTYSLTSHIVNSFLTSYTRNNFPAVSSINQTTPAQIGFTANFVANPQFAGPPFIQLIDSGLTFGNTIQGPQARLSQNYQIQDSISWVKGNHRFKFGADGTKYFQPETFLFVNQGILSYSAAFNNQNTTTGLDLTDFLIGLGPIAQQYGANGRRDFRQLSYSFFGQDSWKVKDNLTVSLGLRWDYVGAITDKGNQVAYYRPGEVSTLLTSGNLRVPGGAAVVPAGGVAPNGLVFPGDPDNILGGTVPRAGYHTPLDNFAPRIGIAWTPRIASGMMHRLFGENQTVIRAGWGVFFDGAGTADTSLQQLSAPGFNGTNSFFFPTGGTLANPFGPSPIPNSGLPTISNPFLASQFAISAPLSQFSQPIDPHLKVPRTYQYNLTVERSFHRDYVLTLSYVGTRGVDLYATEQINPALGTFLSPSLAVTPIPGFPVPDQNNANSRRENNDIQLGLGELVSAGDSWYNAFEANLQKRLSRGLLFQIAYTYSKSIDNSDNSRGLLDLLNRNAGKGLSADDRSNRMVISAIYDLPMFKHSNNFLGRALGGFSIGGIFTYATGTPFTVGNVFDTDGTGGAIVNNADLGAAFQQLDPRKNNTRAFNANAFQAFGNPQTGFNLATDFRRGTEGVNQFRLNNNINNVDFIFSKTTNLWKESTKLELRFEAFNVMNHTQFLASGIDLNLNDAQNFGKYTQAAQSRVIQLGARIKF